MSLKYTKKEVALVAEVLDQEHDSAEAAALACLEVMEQVFEKRAAFTVVGQLRYTPEHGYIEPSDPEALKLAMGWFSTEGEARKAAEVWRVAHATNEEYRVWVLPVFHGTTAGLLSARREELQKAAQKREEARRARLRASVESWRREQRQAVWDWLSDQEKEANPHLDPKYMDTEAA